MLIKDSYEIDNLISLLQDATENHSTTRISVYPAGKADDADSIQSYSYGELLKLARTNAAKLKASPASAAVRPGSVVLVHPDKHSDTIIWFWSVILAGAVPPCRPPQPSATSRPSARSTSPTYTGPSTTP